MHGYIWLYIYYGYIPFYYEKSTKFLLKKNYNLRSIQDDELGVYKSVPKSFPQRLSFGKSEMSRPFFGSVCTKKPTRHQGCPDHKAQQRYQACWHHLVTRWHHQLWKTAPRWSKTEIGTWLYMSLFGKGFRNIPFTKITTQFWGAGFLVFIRFFCRAGQKVENFQGP